MKLARTGLIAALAVLISVPQAAAQHILRMPASGQKPALTFTKDVTTTAPIPRLDLSPMFEVEQDPDPTGLLGLAEEAEGSGGSKWVVGGLTFAGMGGAILYYQMDQEKQGKTVDEDFTKIGGGFVAVGAALLTVGMFVGFDQSPQFWAGKTRSGVAGGVRIPIGR